MADASPGSSTADLKAKKKVLIGLLAVIGTILILYLATVIYFISTGREVRTLTMVPMLGLVVAALPSIINLKAIQAEIAQRESRKE
ncbi:MAG: hypothetical protein IPM66_17815 [Acidobacteriota bacterium]|nr:MAG: hypothetical protein IPM66_17815 [Acidobacteriota bacterium]